MDPKPACDPCYLLDFLRIQVADGFCDTKLFKMQIKLAVFQKIVMLQSTHLKQLNKNELKRSTPFMLKLIW